MKRRGFRGWLQIVPVCSIGAILVLQLHSGASAPVALPAYELVAVFDSSWDTPKGWQPHHGVIVGDDGNLYGTTWCGGRSDTCFEGTVFRVDRAGVLTFLHAFEPGEGIETSSGVLQATDGGLYGTLVDGSDFGGYGAVYRMDGAGNVTILHAFTAEFSGDGAYPRGGVIQGRDGALYGVTSEQGLLGGGTVYRLALDGGFTLLHAFDGEIPGIGVVEGADGHIYGSYHDGAAAVGAFRVTKEGVFTLLTGPEGASSQPFLSATDGHLYGVGRSATAAGSIFRLTTDGDLTTLHTFSGPDGTGPSGPLIQGSDGSYYGLTQRGGAWDFGTIYRMDADGFVSRLHSFDGSGGKYPSGPLAERDGSLYGTTREGGPFNGGVVFRLRIGIPTETALSIAPSPSFLGAGVRLMARVSSDDGSPVGQVEFFDGSAPIGHATLSDGLAVLETVGLTVGSHSLTARFAGNLRSLASRSAPVTHLVLDGADLVETWIGVPPAFLAPGAQFVVTDTSSNQGSRTAGISKTRFFLSFDAVKDGSDVGVAGNHYVPELGPGMSFTGTATVRVPSDVPPALYFLIGCADVENNVSEADEFNNCLPTDGQITVARPDLHQTALSNPPTAASPGSKFVVTDTVHNPTEVVAFSTSTRFYLSTDVLKNAGDVLLGKRSVLEVEPRDTNTGSAKLSIPSSTEDGRYYVVACADDRNKLTETDETNNCRASAETVLIGWPDLLVTSLTNPPNESARGGKFSISDSVFNEGTVPSGGTSNRYYLSLDTLKSGGDVLLTGRRSVPILAPGENSVGRKTVTVPLTAPAGTYYVIACADDPNKVVERIETNNCRASTAGVIIR